MAYKGKPSGGTGRLVKFVGGLVLFLGAGAALLLMQVNFLVGRGLLVAFGDIESTYRGAWVTWDGDASAKDVVLYPWGQGRDDLAVRFDRVEVETPGWIWLLRNAYSKRSHAEADRLHVRLTGVVSGEGLDPSFGDLGVFGAASASPFEAEGCSEDGMWLREELVAMGLSPGPTTLDFDYRIEGGTLYTTVALDTPGVSGARVERREAISGTDNALVIDHVPTQAVYERWTVQDHGFVAARNAWCARKDRVDVDGFVSRHVESVSRLLETAGLGADAAALAAYRAFAAGGGELSFGGDYVQPLSRDVFYDARANGEAMARMHGILERDGRRLAVQWRRFDPRPLPGLDAGMATWDALVRERGGAQATPAGPITAATGPSPVVADPVARPAVASPAADGGVSHANLISPGATLAWADLGGLQGRWIQVWTAHNAPRQVLVLGLDGRQLRVRARLGGGHADYRIDREAFLRATLIQ